MSAELVAVGTELLRYGMADSNGEWLAARLRQAGVEVAARTIVDDDAARAAAVLRGAWSRAEFVIGTGGLGPTADDRTREAIASALDVALDLDAAAAAELARGLATRGRPCGEIELRQAGRPAGTRLIHNPVGTARGILLERGEGFLAALPGVPAEMRAMFEAELAPRLARLGRAPLSARTLRIVGQSESSLERALVGLWGRPGFDLTVLGSPEGLELHARVTEAGTRAAGLAALDALEREIRARLGPDVYATGPSPLHEVVGRLLAARGATVATAESCTAGLVAAALTATPGASAWFRGGLIAYDDRLKPELSGVKRETLAAHGAVSAAVARELAHGARERCRSEFGLGVTGLAGPGGATSAKPVGLVYLALAQARATDERELRLAGARDTIRRHSATAALDLLRRRLLEGA